MRYALLGTTGVSVSYDLPGHRDLGVATARPTP